MAEDRLKPMVDLLVDYVCNNFQEGDGGLERIALEICGITQYQLEQFQEQTPDHVMVQYYFSVVAQLQIKLLTRAIEAMTHYKELQGGGGKHAWNHIDGCYEYKSH